MDLVRWLTYPLRVSSRSARLLRSVLMGDFLSAYALTQGTKLAVVDDRPDGTVRQLTFAELESASNKLANVLLDLSQSASISQSMAAAEQVLRSLDGVGEVRKPRVQQAGFVVLKSPDIPSLLVETAYISNKADESKLRQPAHRARIADAIFGGIQDYFNDNAPDGTRLAAARRSRVADATSGGRL